MHSIESRFVIGPSNNTVWRGVCVCTFQPGNCTSCGSEGVNYENNGPFVQHCHTCSFHAVGIIIILLLSTP